MSSVANSGTTKDDKPNVVQIGIYSLAVVGILCCLGALLFLTSVREKQPTEFKNAFFICPIVIILLTGLCFIVTPELLKTNAFVTSTILSFVFSLLFSAELIYFLRNNGEGYTVMCAIFLIISFISTISHAAYYVAQSQKCISSDECNILEFVEKK